MFSSLSYPTTSTILTPYFGYRAIEALEAHVQRILLRVLTKIVPIKPAQGMNENYPYPIIANYVNKALFIYFPSARVCTV